MSPSPSPSPNKACAWDEAAQRMGVDVEGVGRLALALDKLRVDAGEVVAAGEGVG